LRALTPALSRVRERERERRSAYLRIIRGNS
jgi:hypothetical protein